MRKFVIFAAALAFVIGASLFNSSVAAGSDEGMSAPAIGATIADFKLPDINGAEQTLAALKGKNGTVIVFLSTRCPFVKAYDERIEKLAQDYQARGISVIGINSNSTEPNDEIKSHAAEHYTFPVLIDKKSKVADMLGAERTPEAFFLGADNVLLYHGRIDSHKDPALAQSQELRDAIEARLAGKPVVKTEAAAFGCTIKRA